MLPPLTPYTFGSMSLGKDPVSPASDIAVTRRAMEAGIWFHASRTYHQGFCFMILRMAFDEDRTRTPRMILKIRDGSVPLMRFETEDCCQRLGLESIEIAQLVSMDREPGNLIDQLIRGDGPLVAELDSLKKRGLIRHAVLFFDQGNAESAATAAAHPLIDGLTGYWNATQRDCSDRAWRMMVEQRIPVLALRTLGGWGDEKLSARREALRAALPEADPVQLALDLAASYPEIQTSIGGTASLTHLEHFLAAAASARPLPTETLAAIDAIRCN